MSIVNCSRAMRLNALLPLGALMLLIGGCGGIPVKQKPQSPAEQPAAATTQTAAVPAMPSPSVATAPAPAQAPMKPRRVARQHFRHHAKKEVSAPTVASSVPAGTAQQPQSAPSPATEPPAAPIAAGPAPKGCTSGFFACSHAAYWIVGAIVVVIVALLLLFGIVRKSKGRL